MAKFRYGLFRAKKRDGKLYPKWRIRYFQDGRPLHSEIGFSDKGRTEDRAKDQVREMEHKAHLQAIGAAQVKEKPLHDLVAMWLSELAASGGKQNHPAAPQHVRQCESKIAWWIETLGLTAPQQVNRAEAIAASRKHPASKSTQDQYVQALKTFLNWCVKNEFLGRNPLVGYRKQVSEPTYRRRALIVEEALRLLAIVPDRRALVYKTALMTGMRLQELSSLRVSSVNWDEGTIYLQAAHSKNRKPATFYLPAMLLDELYAYAAGLGMSDPLLPAISPSHAAQTLRRDLKKAEIPYSTAEGVIDFHSLRVTFLTWINELGEDVKTVQELGRHSDPRMTFGIYTKAREARLRSVVTQAGARLLETNRDIPRLGGSHAGVTHAFDSAGRPVFIGRQSDGDQPHVLFAHDRDISRQTGTSSDIKQAKANARDFFAAATFPGISGHSETQELSRRRHALLSQVTEALSGLSEADLQTLAQAIAGLGRGRGVA